MPISEERIREILTQLRTQSQEAARLGFPGAQSILAFASTDFIPGARILANTPVLSPCKTREMFRYGFGSETRFDRFGCAYKPENNLRYLDDCRSDDIRYLCPTGPISDPYAPSGISEELITFIKNAVEIALQIIPIFGPELSRAIGPIIDSFLAQLAKGSLIKELLGEELSKLLDAITEWVMRAFRYVSNELREGVTKIIKTVSATAKVLMDMMPPLSFVRTEDLPRVFSNVSTNLRYGMTQIETLLLGDKPSFDVLRDMAITSTTIGSMSDVMRWLDLQKSLASLEYNTSFLKETIGTLAADRVRMIRNTFPNFETMPSPLIENFNYDALQRQNPYVADGITTFASKFASKGFAFRDAWTVAQNVNAETLSEIVPSSLRSTFVREMTLGQMFMQALKPAIDDANHIQNLTQAEIATVLLQDPPWNIIQGGVDISERLRREQETYLRHLLTELPKKQNAIIQTAAGNINRTPATYTRPAVSQSTALQSATSKEMLSPNTARPNVYMMAVTSPFEYD